MIRTFFYGPPNWLVGKFSSEDRRMFGFWTIIFAAVGAIFFGRAVLYVTLLSIVALIPNYASETPVETEESTVGEETEELRTTSEPLTTTEEPDTGLQGPDPEGPYEPADPGQPAEPAPGTVLPADDDDQDPDAPQREDSETDEEA